MINDVFVATGVDQNVAILRVACQSRFIYQCGEEMRLMNKFSHITMASVQTNRLTSMCDQKFIFPF